MTIASDGGGALTADEWTDIQFTPRRPGETVGAVTARHGEFVFSGSLNKDMPETVTEFWRQAEAARAEHERSLVIAAEIEAMKP